MFEKLKSLTLLIMYLEFEKEKKSHGVLQLGINYLNNMHIRK
jgi:hypothetical protein